MGHKVYDRTGHTIKFWRVCQKERNKVFRIGREISPMLIRSHSHLSTEFFITIFAFFKRGYNFCTSRIKSIIIIHFV